MYERPVLDVEDALALMDAALAAGPSVADRPIAVSVVDENGDWVAFARMDGAPYFVRENAQRKAYTASMLRRDLQELAKAREQTGRGVGEMGDGRLVGARFGGVVIRDADGNALGALGVSGAAPEDDERIAMAALEAAPIAAAGGAA